MTTTKTEILIITLAILAGSIFISDVKADPTPPATKFYWSHSGQMTNGSPAILTASTVYCGTSTGNYTLMFKVTNGADRSTLISNVLDTGKYYCALTASSAEGESGYTSEIFLDAINGTVAPNVPKAPGAFWIGN